MLGTESHKSPKQNVPEKQQIPISVEIAKLGGILLSIYAVVILSTGNISKKLNFSENLLNSAFLVAGLLGATAKYRLNKELQSDFLLALENKIREVSEDQLSQQVGGQNIQITVDGKSLYYNIPGSGESRLPVNINTLAQSMEIVEGLNLDLLDVIELKKTLQSSLNEKLSMYPDLITEIDLCPTSFNYGKARFNVHVYGLGKIAKIPNNFVGLVSVSNKVKIKGVDKLTCISDPLKTHIEEVIAEVSAELNRVIQEYLSLNTAQKPWTLKLLARPEIYKLEYLHGGESRASRITQEGAEINAFSLCISVDLEQKLSTEDLQMLAAVIDNKKQEDSAVL